MKPPPPCEATNKNISMVRLIIKKDQKMDEFEYRLISDQRGLFHSEWYNRNEFYLHLAAWVDSAQISSRQDGVTQTLSLHIQRRIADPTKRGAAF